MSAKLVLLLATGIGCGSCQTSLRAEAVSPGTQSAPAPAESATYLPASSARRETYIPASFDWQPVASGVARYDFKNTAIPLIYHVVRIELGELPSRTLRLEAYPDGSTEKATGSSAYLPKRTEVFASERGCTVAVNASPFSRGANNSTPILGIHKVAGTALSPPLKRYAALAFRGGGTGGGEYRTLSAAIIRSQSAEECGGYDYVFGAYFAVLWEGEEQTFATASSDSRTGAGIDATGSTLYFLAVEGERQEKSRGLSFQECAKVFKALGCYSALEFDGGGSAELCINGKSALSYKVWRPQANSFGFAITESGGSDQGGAD